IYGIDLDASGIPGIPTALTVSEGSQIALGRADHIASEATIDSNPQGKVVVAQNISPANHGFVIVRSYVAVRIGSLKTIFTHNDCFIGVSEEAFTPQISKGSPYP